MKCKLCKKKTDWDSSVGRRSYIVCNHCVKHIAVKHNIDFSDITSEIINIGREIENLQKMLDK